jgi:uncharacterized small protein (DUF1192 family)
MWTSKIVVACMKRGRVAVCVNLSNVNKALVSQLFSLLSMGELNERIAGSTVFSELNPAWGCLQLEIVFAKVAKNVAVRSSFRSEKQGKNSSARGSVQENNTRAST